jgi:hypothetical protein
MGVDCTVGEGRAEVAVDESMSSRDTDPGARSAAE